VGQFIRGHGGGGGGEPRGGTDVILELAILVLVEHALGGCEVGVVHRVPKVVHHLVRTTGETESG